MPSFKWASLQHQPPPEGLASPQSPTLWVREGALSSWGATVVRDHKPGARKNRYALLQSPGGQNRAVSRAACPLGAPGEAFLLCSGGPWCSWALLGHHPTSPASSVCVCLLYVSSTHPFNLRSPTYDHLTLRLLTQSHCKNPFSKPGHVHSFQRLAVHRHTSCWISVQPRTDTECYEVCSPNSLCRNPKALYLRI